MFRVLIAITVLMFASCAVDGDDYIGTWIMRDTGRQMTIKQSGGYYRVSGIEEIEGEYILTAAGTLYSHEGLDGNITRDEDYDVIIITMERLGPKSYCFDREGSDLANENAQEQSTQPVNTVSTSKPIRQWNAKYDDGIFNYNAYLRIQESASPDSMYWYYCTWHQHADGGGTKDYHWLAQMDYENDEYSGYGDLWKENISLIIRPQRTGEYGQYDSTLILYIQPPNEKEWHITFRK